MVKGFTVWMTYLVMGQEEIKWIKNINIKVYVVVNFLSQVIFSFLLFFFVVVVVSTSLAYIIIPKNKRKRKITWDKINYNIYKLCNDCMQTFQYAEGIIPSWSTNPYLESLTCWISEKKAKLISVHVLGGFSSFPRRNWTLVNEGWH